MSRAIITGKYQKVIGDNLKLLLKTNKLSQSKLSEKIGITKATINRYLKGNRNITLDRLVLLADFFDISIDELLNRDPKNNINYREECLRYEKKLKAIYEILGENND